MAGGKTTGILARGWRTVREAGAQRLLLSALLLVAALLLARFSWILPVTDEAENRLYDLRTFMLAEQVPQDERIALVVYTDQTLINARKRSPLDRGVLAAALRNLDGMGARAIGIDVLFDQPQDEDDELIATLRAMKTPVVVAYADAQASGGTVTFDQQAYLDRFLARLGGRTIRPATVTVSNADGVTRTWPRIAPDSPPTLGRAMLAAAGEEAKALPGYEGAIRYRRAASKDVPRFSSLQIDGLTMPELASALAPGIAGRYVLVGGDIVDFDRFETPLTAATGDVPPGIQIHAEMLAQMLDGASLPRPLPVALWAAGLLVVLCAALTGLVELRSWRIYPLIAAQFAALIGLPFLLHAQGIDTHGLPAAGWVLGWVVAFIAVSSAARAAGSVQRRFAQGALGKYLPPEMAEEIIENPALLRLHGERKQLFVLFSDLEGFTRMSHALEPETVATLLNRYLETLSQVVLDHGGVIDKFVGDAVVAFWGAPIAKPDDGERAARAGLAMWQAGEDFRRSVDPDLPPIGKTRVGLHWGEAVVGNFGGENRIQYTALGDSMNTAARLEAASKTLDSSVMASREFAERSGLDWWRPMGRVVLRGRTQPIDLFEPAPDFPDDDRRALYQAMILLESDAPGAIAVIAGLVARHPQDAALANLLRRTRELPEDGAFVLG